MSQSKFIVELGFIFQVIQGPDVLQYYADFKMNSLKVGGAPPLFDPSRLSGTHPQQSSKAENRSNTSQSDRFSHQRPEYLDCNASKVPIAAEPSVPFFLASRTLTYRRYDFYRAVNAYQYLTTKNPSEHKCSWTNHPNVIQSKDGLDGSSTLETTLP